MYELGDIIGRGTNGLVLAARDRTTGQDVAIKVVAVDFSSCYKIK